MKRFISILITAVMLTVTACGGNGSPAPAEGSTGTETASVTEEAPTSETSGNPDSAEDRDIAVQYATEIPAELIIDQNEVSVPEDETDGSITSPGGITMNIGVPEGFENVTTVNRDSGYLQATKEGERVSILFGFSNSVKSVDEYFDKNTSISEDMANFMDVIEDSDVETMDIGENHVYYKRYVVQDNVKDIVKDKYLSCSDMNGEIFVVSIENYYDIGADHFETTQELLKEAWSGVSRADG